ncbi:MAG: hypothetical protein IT544_00025 [Rhodobacteraceae bacterium]|nr:hypothetical protein [Paracoccaceae bacterium]
MLGPRRESLALNREVGFDPSVYSEVVGLLNEPDFERSLKRLMVGHDFSGKMHRSAARENFAVKTILEIIGYDIPLFGRHKPRDDK